MAIFNSYVKLPEGMCFFQCYIVKPRTSEWKFEEMARLIVLLGYDTKTTNFQGHSGDQRYMFILCGLYCLSEAISSPHFFWDHIHRSSGGGRDSGSWGWAKLECWCLKDLALGHG